MSDDKSLFEHAAQIPTATWSDALDTHTVGGVLDGLSWRSGDGRFAGPAVVAAEEVAAHGTYELRQFDVGGLLAATYRGCVLVVVMASTAEVSTLGGLAAFAAVKRGVAGVVIDGGCRDLEEIRGSGLRLASRHVTPRSGKQRVRVAAIGGAIVCGGVRVAEGDVVISDETGIVVVPRASFPDVLRTADELVVRDVRFRRDLDQGADFAAVAARLRHL